MRLPAGQRIVRVMPNTPCLIGRGASGYSLGEHATQPTANWWPRCFRRWARVRGSRGMLDAVTGLSGSGPAFVYSMIEALDRGGRGSWVAGRARGRAGRANGGRRCRNGAANGRDAGRAARARHQPRRHDAGRFRQCSQSSGFKDAIVEAVRGGDAAGRRTGPIDEVRIRSRCRFFVASMTSISRSTA